MTVQKSWAFIAATGHEKVTAWSIARLRDKQYGGRPTGDTYYSTHKEGRRRPMSHVWHRGRQPFFRYIETADEHEGGPGESLQHRLFKEAVASITRTRLQLKGLGSHPIEVTHAELEKEIRHADGRYFADVYFCFQSESELGIKWAGELYLEIRKTHQVPGEKLRDANMLRVPMIEVDISPSLLYQYDDDQTTDAREAAYRQRIKNMLESENGFLPGIVLSNPSSAEYLQRQLDSARQQLDEAQRRATVAETALASARGQLQQLASSVAETNRLRTALDEASRAQAGAAVELTRLKNRFSSLEEARQDEELARLAVERRFRRFRLLTALLAAAALLAGGWLLAAH